jgi:hypothetical protein
MLILSEENSKLKKTTYKLPIDIIKLYFGIVEKYPQFINDPGYKRSENVIKNDGCVTMEWLKNMKHFFSITDINSDSYRLSGGDIVRDWVNNKLSMLTSSYGRSKKNNSPTKPRNETSALVGMHGDHQSSSLSMVNSLMGGLIPNFESISRNKILIITEEQLKSIKNKTI